MKRLIINLILAYLLVLSSVANAAYIIQGNTIDLANKQNVAKEIIRIDVGNPLVSRFPTYSSLTSNKISGSMNASDIWSTEGNSKFMDVTFYSNGFAKVTTINRSNKFIDLYIRHNVLTPSTNIININRLQTQVTNKECTLYTDLTCQKAIHKLAKGKTYKVLYQQGNKKQIYAFGRGQHTAIGWINDVGNNDNVIKPKELLLINLGNPIVSSIPIYSSLTSNVISKYVNANDIWSNMNNCKFMDVTIFDNGFAKITTIDKNNKYIDLYIKHSVLTPSGNLKNINSLPTQVTNKEYTLYTDNSCKKEIQKLAKGKMYKLLHQQNNKKQIYAFGRGQYTAIGWINEEMPSTNIKGDVDNNGRVDNNDKLALQNYLVGKQVASFDKNNADINKDGKISSTDLTLLNNMLNPFVDAKLSNGWYEIIPAYDNTGRLRIDVDNSVDKDGVNIKLCNSNNEYAQRFYLENTSDGYFTLRTGCSTARYVTMQECSNVAGNNIIQKQLDNFNGRIQQKFKLTKLRSDNGMYFIDSKFANGAVIGYSNLAHLGNVATMLKDINSKYKWKFKGVAAPELKVVYPASGLYSIQPKCALGKELTVQNASIANNANVCIYYADSLNHVNIRSHQKWNVQRIGNTEWYKITAENSGRALNIHNGISSNGTPVTIYDYGNDKMYMHQFRFLDAGNGYYVIQGNVGGKFVLDVQNGANVSGADVRMWEFNGTDAQKWRLEKRTGYVEPRPVPPFDKFPAESKVKITKNGQVVDTFNGVSAIYPIYGVADGDETYNCAAYIKKYYQKMYGFKPYNLLPYSTPKGINGKLFTKVIQPQAGDIVGIKNSSGKINGHWAIAKGVEGNYIVLIEQNMRNKNTSYPYVPVNRRIHKNQVNIYRFNNIM